MRSDRFTWEEIGTISSATCRNDLDSDGIVVFLPHSDLLALLTSGASMLGSGVVPKSQT